MRFRYSWPTSAYLILGGRYVILALGLYGFGHSRSFAFGRYFNTWRLGVLSVTAITKS